MVSYLVIETDDGLTVAEVQPGMELAEAAERHGGVIVDTNVYKTYDDAYDALLALQADDEDDDLGLA